MNPSFIEVMNTTRKAHRNNFGLIGETAFWQPELHGFEVDLNGHVVIPELNPRFEIVIQPHPCALGEHQGSIHFLAERGNNMRNALRQHWPEYVMEAAELGLFMMSACVFTTILGHPASPVAQAIGHPLLGRLLMGLAMGLTAISIIYSPLGKQSGGHFNPSVTLTFFRLGKVKPWDAFFYSESGLIYLVR